MSGWQQRHDIEDFQGCIISPGFHDRDGYGRRKAFGEQMAHRAAWVEVHGPIPEGMSVLHRCDNPPCINVDHLFLGTQSDNVKDMNAKGRHGYTGQRGERNPNVKLTDEQVREIRASTEGSTILAERYGVHYRHIWLIRRGLTRRDT